MSELWVEASRDLEAERASDRFTRAKVAASDVWTFLAAARDGIEFSARRSLVTDALDRSIAEALGPEELGAFLDVRTAVDASLAEDFALLQAARTVAAPAESPQVSLPTYPEPAAPEVAFETGDHAPPAPWVPEEVLASVRDELPLDVLTATGPHVLIDGDQVVAGPYDDARAAHAALRRYQDHGILGMTASVAPLEAEASEEPENDLDAEVADEIPHTTAVIGDWLVESPASTTSVTASTSTASTMGGTQWWEGARAPAPGNPHAGNPFMTDGPAYDHDHGTPSTDGPHTTPKSTRPAKQPDDPTAQQAPVMLVQPVRSNEPGTSDPNTDAKNRVGKLNTIADGILATNPGLSREAALRVAGLTLGRYPGVVKEAKDVSDPRFRAGDVLRHKIDGGEYYLERERAGDDPMAAKITPPDWIGVRSMDGSGVGSGQFTWTHPRDFEIARRPGSQAGDRYY